MKNRQLDAQVAIHFFNFTWAEKNGFAVLLGQTEYDLYSRLKHFDDFYTEKPEDIKLAVDWDKFLPKFSTLIAYTWKLNSHFDKISFLSNKKSKDGLFIVRVDKDDKFSLGKGETYEIALCIAALNFLKKQ